MSEFRDLHRPGTPLVLPNAWDHASAAALAHAGFRAIATTSLGVAIAAGKPDASGATRAETVALARSIAPLGLISVDAETGFGADAGELAVELADAGVVGLNIEDALSPAAETAARVAAIKAAAPRLFVNARTDVYWLGDAPDPVEALRRAHAYLEAGADGIFIPGVTDYAVIGELVAAIEAPLNVLFSPQLELQRLADLGVARVSTGSFLFRAALGAALACADAIRAGRPLPPVEPLDVAGALSLS